MLSKKNPSNRVKKYRWISVDSIEKPQSHNKPITKYKELTNINTDSLDIYDDSHLPQSTFESPPTVSSITPKYTFSKSPRKPSKYYCPYYISPKKWNIYTKMPEKTEKQEIERVKNFYYHMHDTENSLFSMKSQENSSTLKNLSIELKSLPPIQKYKQYLISKSLRLPSFLNSTYSP